MISLHVDARTATRVLYKSYNALHCDALSPVPHLEHFLPSCDSGDKAGLGKPEAAQGES